MWLFGLEGREKEKQLFDSVWEGDEEKFFKLVSSKDFDPSKINWNALDPRSNDGNPNIPQRTLLGLAVSSLRTKRVLTFLIGLSRDDSGKVVPLINPGKLEKASDSDLEKLVKETVATEGYRPVVDLRKGDSLGYAKNTGNNFAVFALGEVAAKHNKKLTFGKASRE